MGRTGFNGHKVIGREISAVKRETPILSDHEDMARFLLQKGYRTAKQTTTDNYNAAQRRSDNKSAKMWHNIGLWVNMLK